MVGHLCHCSDPDVKLSLRALRYDETVPSWPVDCLVRQGRGGTEDVWDSAIAFVVLRRVGTVGTGECVSLGVSWGSGKAEVRGTRKVIDLYSCFHRRWLGGRHCVREQ